MINFGLIRKFAICTVFACLIFAPNVYGGTYYVRPAGGSYGSEDGSDYENAWDGFSNIVWSSLSGGGTLFVAGTHTSALTIGTSGSNDSNRVWIKSCTTANGASTNDAGVINGATIGQYTGLVNIANRSYITVYGLTLSNAVGAGVEWHNGIKINADGGTTAGITISHCIITGNDGNGLQIDGGGSVTTYNHSGLIVEHNDITDNVGNGLIAHRIYDTFHIRYNYISGNGTSPVAIDCTDNDSGMSFYHNIYIDLDCVDGAWTYIYGNRLEDCECGQNIKLKHNGDIYHNYIQNGGDYGVMLIESSGKTDVQRLYANVIVSDDKTMNCVGPYAEGTGNQTIYVYNNSCYQKDNVGTRAMQPIGNWDGGSGSINTCYIKNNVLHVTYTQSSDVVYYFTNAPVTKEINTNCIYGYSTNVAQYAGSARTLTQWRALGFDTEGNGIAADPKYNDKANFDLTLDAESPCIDAGENLGNDYKYALDPSTTWTRETPGIDESSVIAVSQDDYGSGWEIGAYIYGASQPDPTPLHGISITGVDIN